MKKTVKPSRIKTVSLVLLAILFAAYGCAGPKVAAKVAADLLANARTNEQPLTNHSAIVNATIDPSINNREKLDETVKQSLEIALAKANIFGVDAFKPYTIDAHILVASQSPMSFGSFEGKLEIHYNVHNPDDEKIFEKKIFTVAGSDKQYFSGAKRHRRARAVNISKNVLQFVEILQNKLNQ